MQVDSHGFPMRDDLKQHTRIIRVAYDGKFSIEGGRLKKLWKEAKSSGRPQTAERKK